MYLFWFPTQAEIEKVKKRREERAIEKAQHEEEMVSLDNSVAISFCEQVKKLDTCIWIH